MAKVQIMGFVGKDATINLTNGKTVVNFNVAETERYKKQDGTDINETTWYKCSLWIPHTQKVTIHESLKKGRFIIVEGKLKVGMYKNKENQMEVEIKINVTELHFTPDGKGKDQSQNSNANIDANFVPTCEDDLPF